MAKNHSGVSSGGILARQTIEDDVLTHRAKLSPSAFAELHRRHVDSVYRHILACVSDVAQDVAP